MSGARFVGTTSGSSKEKGKLERDLTVNRMNCYYLCYLPSPGHCWHSDETEVCRATDVQDIHAAPVVGETLAVI